MKEIQRHWFTAYLTEHYSSGKQLGLDIGCGRRPYDDIFRCKYIGIDLPSNKLSETKKPNLFGSGTNLPFDDNVFDFITCYSVVPYVDEVDKLFEEMYRILKPNGVAIIIIMNMRGLALDPNGYYPNRFNSRKLHQKLKQHNFKSIKTQNIKALLFSTYFDLTSVYAYALVIPNK